ncbi:TolC family protein [Persephonella sp.]
MQTKVITVILIICLSSFANGESIEQLIERAKEKNPEIKRIEKELKIQKKKAEVSRKLFNPSVSLTFGGSDALEKPYKAVTFKISQKIPYPKKLDKIYEIETKSYEEKYYFLISKRNEIIKKIYDSVFKLWYIREKIKTYKKYIDLTEDLYRDLDGYLTYGDRMKFLLLKENLHKEKQSLMIDEKIEKFNLEALINDDLNEVNISLDLMDISDQPDGLLDVIYQNNPLLQSYRKKLDKLKESFELSKMIYYPDISLSLKTTPEDRLSESFSVGLGVNIPIWRTIRQEKIVLETQLKKVSIEEEINFIKNQLKFQFLSSYYRIKKEVFIFEKIKRNIKNRHEINIKISKLEFKQGKRDISDLIIAVENSLNSDLEAVSSIYLTNIEYINIKSLLGEL